MGYYIEEFILTVMDALEALFDTVTVPVGKKLIEVLKVLLAFLAFSVFCEIVDLPTFVSWVEALIACVIMGLILLINTISKSSIEEAKAKFIKLGGRR